ncbi:uncharacterized protein V6R79_014266 [Siganus canaliculatus]
MPSSSTAAQQVLDASTHWENKVVYSMEPFTKLQENKSRTVKKNQRSSSSSSSSSELDDHGEKRNPFLFAL